MTARSIDSCYNTMSTTLIYGGTLVTSDEVFPANILIAGDKIEKILPPEEKPSAEKTIDASGLHIFAGVIDAQVHFRDPGLTHKEDLETGSRAAVSGGVTSFFEMPNTKPATITVEALAAKKQRAAQVSYANYNFFFGATSENLDVLNSAENVPGIKIFMGSSTGDLLVDSQEALENIFANGSRLIAVHAEDETTLKQNAKDIPANSVHDHYRIRSAEAALTATKRAVALSQKYNRRLHILHLSTLEEVDFLRKEKTPLITIEATPQHLLLSAPGIYDEKGTLAQMNPPIRMREHTEVLWKALKDGVIDMVATDHAPHTLQEKDQPYGKAPSGMPGVETLLPAMLNTVSEGKSTLQEVALWLSEQPAIVYQVEKRGFLSEGFYADLAIVDLSKKKKVTRENLQTKSGWSIWEDRELQGWPVMTFVNGCLAWSEGEFHRGCAREVDFLK